MYVCVHVYYIYLFILSAYLSTYSPYPKIGVLVIRAVPPTPHLLTSHPSSFPSSIQLQLPDTHTPGTHTPYSYTRYSYARYSYTRYSYTRYSDTRYSYTSC